MKPEVSVYCTVKNGEKTLPATLQSILDQRGVTWELVVVDDGSSDGTLDLLNRFARALPSQRVRIIPTPGLGRGAALNLAWRECRADLLANIDADDLFHPDKLRVQARVMEARADTVLLTTDSIIVGSDQSPTWVSDVARTDHQPDPDPQPDPVPRDITSLLGRFNPVNHSSVMMRRSFLESVGGYDATRTRQLDYELWARAIERGFRVHQLGEPLSAKRLHAGQSFKARVSGAYVLSSFHLQNRIIRALGLPFRYYLLALARVVYRFSPAPLRRLLARRKTAALSTPAR